MKRIGLVGGLSWHSTLHYYQGINQAIQSKLGELHSGKMILHSLNFADVITPWQRGNWDQALEPIIDAINALEHAGAEAFLICSNAVHYFATTLAEKTMMPLIHISDSVSKAIKKQSLKTVALLGTQFTMEADFYPEHLKAHGIDVITPELADRRVIDHLIFSELTQGKVSDNARQMVTEIIRKLQSLGAEGIVLACTELPMLFADRNNDFILFDTVDIHVNTAVEYMLSS